MRWIFRAVLLCALVLPGALAEVKSAEKFRTAEAKQYFQRGIGFSEKGLWNAALAQLDQARRVEGENPLILIELGRVLSQCGRYDEALQVLKKAVSIDPTTALAHYQLGLHLERAAPELNLAGEHYKKSLELDPANVPVILKLVDILPKNQTDEILRLLETALQQEPGNAAVYWKRGVLFKQSDPERAIQELQSAVRLDPEHLEARRELAFLLLGRERLDEAVSHFREILTRNAEDRAVRYSLGQALIRRGEVGEGRKELEAARQLRILEEKRSQATRLLETGIDHISRSHWEQAIKSFREALQADPNLIEAHVRLGSTLAATGNLEAGLTSLRNAIGLAPDDTNAHHNLGTVYLQAGQLEQASQHFRTALKLDPLLPETHNNMGLVLVRENRIEEALDQFRRANELDPFYLEGIFNLGLLLYQLGRMQEALSSFQNAEELAPENPKVHQALSSVLEEMGDQEGARQARLRAQLLEQQASRRREP